MKLNNILLAAVITMPGVASATEPVDTLTKVDNANRLIITESPDRATIKITRAEKSDSLVEVITRSFDGPVALEQRKWYATLPLTSGIPDRWALCMGGPGIGWINSVGQPDGMGAEMGKSLEISWLNMISIKYTMPWKSSILSIGFGFDWRNYRISTGASRFVPVENGGVAVDAYPADVQAHGSRLKVFSMGIPVLWGQDLGFRWIDGSKFFLSAGVVMNFNTHGSLLTQWTDADGNKVKQKSNHIGQRRFTVDLMALAKIGWGLNLYVRYSPQTVLRGAGQPKFRPFSTGLILYY